MKDVIQGLVRYLLCQRQTFEAEIGAHVFDPTNKSAVEACEQHGTIAHVYLTLYLTPHAANPYYGRSEVLATFLDIIRGWIASFQRSLTEFGHLDTAEWPPYIICRGLELVRDHITDDLREQLSAMLARYVEQVAPRPFFFTAPNHEIWKLATMALAGKVLGCQEWIREAEFQTCQLLAYQTPEGFWEEGRHHGPALQYATHMLAGLALVARQTRNKAIRDAARRQANFLVRWAFPDGVVVGAFDGRRPTSMGTVVPGFELVPSGLTFMRRCIQAWERAGWLDPSRVDAPLYRRPFKGDYVAAESLLYYNEYMPKIMRRSAALPMDRNGATLQNHTPSFDGVMGRRGPWVVAISSQLSDVPKDTQWIYRLERQTRLEIWHEKASVVIGGGHSLVTAEYPLYNAWVDSGYGIPPPPEDYAHQNGLAASPTMALRRSKYYPRAAFSGVNGNRFWLELVFAHATVKFEVVPHSDSVTVRYRYRCLGVRELRLALSLMLWEGATAEVNGKRLERTAHPTDTEGCEHVAVKCPAYRTRSVLIPPSAGSTHVLFPLRVMQNYHAPAEEERVKNPYAIAFVETILGSPGEVGKGEWRLTVEET